MDEKGEVSVISQEAMRRWDYRLQGGRSHCHLDFYFTNPRLADVPALASANSVKKCGFTFDKNKEDRRQKEQRRSQTGQPFRSTGYLSSIGTLQFRSLNSSKYTFISIFIFSKKKNFMYLLHFSCVATHRISAETREHAP